MEYKALTTRLPLVVYEAIGTYKANVDDVSLNQFVIEAIEEKLARVRQEQLRLDVQELAEDFDLSEVEPWLDAQKRTMRLIGD